MEEPTLRDEIRKLISRNKTEDVFELLASIQFSKADKELILLSSQYNRIKEELRLNIISKDEGERRINQINMALLDISTKVDSSQPAAFQYQGTHPKKQSFNPKWLLLLLIPLVAFLLYWGISGTDDQVVESTPIDPTLVDQKPVDRKPVDPKPVDQKPVDSKPFVDVSKLSSLVAYYPLDGSGIDKHSGHNAINTIGVKSHEGRNGKSDGSFYFDGKESRIELPKLLDSQSKNYSISVWIKTLNGPNSIGTIWGQYTKSDTKNIGANHYVQLRNSYLIHDNYPPNGHPTKFNEIASNNIETNKWTHVVFTHNSSFVEFYLNGVKIAEYPETETFETKDWGDAVYSVLGISPQKGGAATWRAYNGWIDDFMVFDQAIDANTVSKLYNLEYKY